MMLAKNRNHPRTMIDGQPKPWPLCKAATGFPTTDSKFRRSDLEQYGTGVVLYFQFIKYLCLLFAVSMVLAVPSMVIFVSGNTQARDSDFKSAISMFSLGNIGSTRSACTSGTYSERLSATTFRASLYI